MSLPSRWLVLVALGACSVVAVPTASAGTYLQITVRSQTLSSSQTDRGALGPSQGDVAIVRDRLVAVGAQLGRPAGAAIGADRADFQYTSATRYTVTGVTQLPGGTLSVRGYGDVSRSRATLAVVGGTGRFAGAYGSVVVDGKGDAPINTYRLLVG